MTPEHIPTPSPMDLHIQSLSRRFSSVPELQPVVDVINSDPTHVNEIYSNYVNLAGRLVDLDGTDYDAIVKSQQQMSGEVGSASTLGANDLASELKKKNIDLLSIVSSSTDSSSPYYEPAVNELVERLEAGHAMKTTGKTPSDTDPDSLKVIWGHTVITGQEALLHFATMHYLERFVSKSLTDQNVPIAKQKDFFINAMTDVVILNGLRSPGDPIFKLWKAPKDQGGLGWITDDRLASFSDTSTSY